MLFSTISRFTGLLLLALISTTATHAGVIYEMTNTDYIDGVASDTASSHVAIDGNNLKMSLPEKKTGREGEMIFQGDKGRMLMIDHQRQQYFILDKATIDQINAQMNQAMEMIKNVPPAQREMMEKMMKGRMPQMKAPAKKQVEIKKTSERKKLNGYETVKYEVFEDGRKKSEYWVADWEEIKGSENALRAFKSMSSFFSEIMNTFSSGPMGDMIQGKFDSNWMGQLEKLNGFPVVTRTFDSDGKLLSESALGSAKKADFHESYFQAPKSYKRQEMNMR
jgi:hypothetical protein